MGSAPTDRGPRPKPRPRPLVQAPSASAVARCAHRWPRNSTVFATTSWRSRRSPSREVVSEPPARVWGAADLRGAASSVGAIAAGYSLRLPCSS